MDPIETKPTTSTGRRRRPQRRRKGPGRRSVCEAILGSVVVGSMLAVGTVHVSVLLVIAAAALVGASLESMSLRRVPAPALVLALLAFFSALQAVPLPAAWVNAVSTSTGEVWQRCLIPFAEPGLRRFSLSLDAGASIAEALKWLTYACVYIMATCMRARRGSAWLALLLFGSAVLATFVTLVHGLFNVPALYGFYRPNFTPGRWNVGPLLNSNNLAGYAILGLFSGGGLLLGGRSPVTRGWLLAGLASTATALYLSGSRAGVLSVLLAGALAVLWLLSSRGTGFSLSDLALAIAPLAIGVVIAFSLGSAHDADQLASLDMHRKTSVWLWSWPMIRDHAAFGVGRGAFESAFPPYRGSLDYDWTSIVTHAENFVVQWLAEWGLPVGVGAVLLITGYVAREWYFSRGDRLRFTVMTGLVALFVQNLADLGLEIPALAIAAVLALAAGERSVTRASNDSSKGFGKRALLVAVPALGLWLATCLWSRLGVEIDRSRLGEAYHDLAVHDPQQRANFRARLREAVLRHPGESYFPLLGSLVAMRSRQGNALPWIARSLSLSPTNGPVHLVLAQLLRQHGATKQAMLHLRLAAQYDRTLAGAVSTHAALWAPLAEELIQAIPDGPYGDGMLLDACARELKVDVKIECFQRAAERSPRSPEAQQRLAESMLQAIRDHQPPCNGQLVERCTAQVEVAVRRAGALDPKSWRPSYLMSKVLLARGDAAGAARVLIQVCPPSAEGDECWRDAIRISMESGSNETISAVVAGFAARPCEGAEACANGATQLAEYLHSGGQAAMANSFYTKAATTDPSAARWLKVAVHAMQSQLYGVARTALERADRSPDASVSTRAETELLRQRVVQAAAAPL